VVFSKDTILEKGIFGISAEIKEQIL